MTEHNTPTSNMRMNEKDSQSPNYSQSQKNIQKLKTQTQPNLILLYYAIYELNQYDDQYLKYLQDRLVKGKQTKISKHIDWMLKDQKDFRYKISKLIFQIAKKILNQNEQSNPKNQSSNFFVKKGNLLQCLFQTLIQELKTLKFDNTISVLESKEVKEYCDTKFFNQVQGYKIQLKEFQKLGHVFDQMKNKLEVRKLQLSTYKKIIDNRENTLKESQKTIRPSNIISSKQQNQSQNAQTVQISLKDIKQIANLKNKIQNALQLLRRSVILNRGNYYTINSSQFDNNLKLISQKIKRIQQLAKRYQNQNSKQKKGLLMRATQPIKLQVKNIDKVNSNSSQIQQLKQRLKIQQLNAKNNSLEITKLNKQLEQMKETNQNLQILNTQLQRLIDESQNKIKGLHNQCNSKDIQQITLRQLNTKISKDLNNLIKQVEQYRQNQEQKNQTQEQLKTQLDRLNNELKDRITQNKGLTNKINLLNVEVNQKNNLILLKESQIRALKMKQQQFDSKIFQEQKKQSIPQRRSVNFRSFNTKQKSTAKNGVSSNEVSKSPSKNQQINASVLTIQNKKQSNLPSKIEKINHQSQKKQNDKKQKLNFQPKVLNYRFTAKIKDDKKQLQGMKIKIDNPMRKQDKKIDQSPKVNEKPTRAVSLKQKAQQQWIKQLKQKESKIESQKEQIRKLASIIQQLNKKIEEISKQNSSNKKEVEDLLKSNQKLREQQRKSLQLQVQLKKIKENQKNIIQDKKSDQPESHELKKLQQNYNEKCNQISQMQKTIENLSAQVFQLQNDKLKLQKTIQSLKIQQKETVQKNVEKSKIKTVTATQKNQEKQIISSLQAQKKEMKIKILSLELDLDQKQQHYQELREKYKKQTTALKNQIQSLTSVTPGFQSEIGTLKNEIKKRQQVLRNKQKDVQNLNTKIIELQTATQKQNEDTKRIEEQLKDLKKENESMERQITRLCNERDKLESENNNLIDKSKNEKRLHKEEIDKMKKDQALQIKNLRLENARQVQEIRRQIKSEQYAQRIRIQKIQNLTQGTLNILMKERNQFQQENRKLKEQLTEQKQILQSKKEEMKNTMQKAIQDFISSMK